MGARPPPLIQVTFLKFDLNVLGYPHDIHKFIRVSSKNG